jgi:hypothetical protein
MPNRNLTQEEREIANRLLDEIRHQIEESSLSNESLKWALRRYIYLRLQYDERGSSMKRRALKAKLVIKQHALCAICGKTLAEKGSVLDRIEAMKGYNLENTRLLCPDCDTLTQESRHYA